MRDLLCKLGVLLAMLRGIYDTWETEVWVRDLDENYCCSGRECGCGGISVREVFETQVISAQNEAQVSTH